MAHNTLKLAL